MSRWSSMIAVLISALVSISATALPVFINIISSLVVYLRTQGEHTFLTLKHHRPLNSQHARQLSLRQTPFHYRSTSGRANQPPGKTLFELLCSPNALLCC